MLKFEDYFTEWLRPEDIKQGQIECIKEFTTAPSKFSQELQFVIIFDSGLRMGLNQRQVRNLRDIFQTTENAIGQSIVMEHHEQIIDGVPGSMVQFTHAQLMRNPERESSRNSSKKTAVSAQEFNRYMSKYKKQNRKKIPVNPNPGIMETGKKQPF